MATVEPPPSIARVVEVQNPGSGHYVVYVRIPPHFATKFPDKPWGTPIESIGLAEKDITKFKGYVLVDMENISDRRVGDSADLFWVFQKLDGPQSNTTSDGNGSLIPDKFSRAFRTVRVKQEVPRDANPTQVGVDGVISSSVEQIENTGKALRTDIIEEQIGGAQVEFSGQEYGDIVTKDVSESIVAEGTSADTGINVISSVVEPTGDGRAVKQTKSAMNGTNVGWPDPVEKEVSKELPDLFPAKFRKFITRVFTTKKTGSFPAGNAITLASGEVAKSFKRETPDRIEERTVTESVEANAKLTGKQLNRYGTLSTVEESLETDPPASDNEPNPNYLTLDVSDTPLGNGKAVRRKETVESFPQLTGRSTDKSLSIPVTYREQVVDASTVPENPVDPLVEYQPIDKLRTLKRTTVVPTSSLGAYMLVLPVRVPLPELPRELISVEVKWNDSFSIGTQDFAFYISQQGTSYAFNEKASDTASSQASVSAELSVRYRDFAVGYPKGNRYTFFLPQGSVSNSAALAKVRTINSAIDFWPTFRPESITLVVTGQSVNVRTNVDVGLTQVVSSGQQKTNGWSRGTSDDFSVSLGNQSVQLPPCIHGVIAVSGGTYREKVVSATAFMNMFAGGATISATKTKEGTAFGRVEPSSIAATPGPTTVPTSGEYIIDIDSAIYEHGYVRVVVTTFDASSLAAS